MIEHLVRNYKKGSDHITALYLLISQGIQDPSMSQISKTFGVAVGTIYNHFTTKERLIE